MLKLILRISAPIILVGIFTLVSLVATGYENLEPSFYMMILFLAVYIFFFGFAVGQNIFSPVQKILNNATKLSEGDLSSRVYIETKDELSQLAGVLNKIAEKMEASRCKEEEIEKEIGIKVVARTRELEETIKALEQKVKNRTAKLEKLISESNRIREDSGNKKTETSQLKKEQEV